jgi:type II secretory pathway component GspD/PulD (secretin)
VVLDVQLELSDLIEIRNNIPVVDRATAQSSVIVANGGAVILGGLRQHSRTKVDRGTPGLRKVPVLGALFRTRRRDHAESEIVLILRPVIVGDSEPVPEHEDIKIPIDSATKKEQNIIREPVKLID